MQAFYYFLNLISFISTLFASLLIILLYLKNRKSVILYILLFFSPFTIGSLIWLLSTSYVFPADIIEKLHIINGALAFITAPLACLKIVGLTIRKTWLIIMLLFGLIAIYILTANLLFSNAVIVTTTLILRLSGLGFVYFLLFRNRKNIQIQEMKAFYNSMLISAAAVLLVLLFMIALRFFNLELYNSVKELPMDQIFSLILSSLISVFLARFFFVNELNITGGSYLEKFNLTAREQEIVNLILNGYTSKEASRVLNISQQTVKNHTASIYKKLEINSKIELSRLISNS